MINIAVCDDEEFYLQKEQSIISGYMTEKGYEYNIDLFSSGKEFLESENTEQYDIVFLDITMDEIDGIETAKRIRANHQKVYLVFVTAYITYSTEGYKVDASRYILKNDLMFEAAMEESLDSIIRKMEVPENKHTFSFQEGKREINLSDIIYIESNLHKLIFHMNTPKNSQYFLYGKLDVIETAIGKAGLCRIHKSYLVNMKYVENMERYKIYLKDGTKLSIAKPRYPVVKEAFLMRKGEYDD